jgi:thiamine biosynthesis protein ThiS
VDGEIEVEVNGATRRVPAGATVEDLIASLGLRPEVVAAEVGRRLVPRSERSRRTLCAGDQIELVTLVGGG